MKESTETRTTEKPQWLELTEPDKQAHTYWTCFGHVQTTRKSWKFWQKPEPFNPRSLTIYHSREEAEARAYSCPNLGWEWDRNPARPITLQDVMSRARVAGIGYVSVLGFRDGQWVTLKSWKAGEPLMGEEL